MSVTEKAPASVRELMERYDEAWNAHDLDTIMELSTPDTTFRLRGAGPTKVWEGADACREAYGYLLQAVPDQNMVRTLDFVSEGIYVANHDFKGTFALPWEMGGKTYAPTGQAVEFEMVDIMYTEGNLVKVKDGWIDGFSVAQQFEAQAS